MRMPVFAACGAAAMAFGIAPACGDPYASSPEPTDEAGIEAGLPDSPLIDSPVVEAAADAGPKLRVSYARGFGGSSDVAADGGSVSVGYSGLFVDPAGGVRIAGNFSVPSVDFGGGAIQCAGAADAYLLQLDGKGDHVSSQAFGDSEQQYGGAVTASGTTTYLGVIFKGTVDFGGGPLATVGNFNSMLVRFLPAYGGQEVFRGDISLIRNLAPRVGGGVWAFGQWTTDLSTLGSAFATNGSQMFLARVYPLSPEPTAVRVFGGPGNGAVASGLAASDSGDVVITGRFTGTVDFGDAGNVSSPTDSDAYVTRIESNLEPRWARVFGGVGAQEGLSVAFVPKTKDVVVAGVFSGSLSVPGRSPVQATGGDDIFVARLDNSGNVTWLTTFGGAEDERANGVSADADGNVFVTGFFRSPTIDFGGGSIANADATGRNSSDAFVTWLDPGGKYVAAQRYGDGADQAGQVIALDGSGAIVVAGNFSGTMDVGGKQLTAIGATNAWVAKLTR